MKKALKKLAAMVLAAAMCVSMGATGFAQDKAEVDIQAEIQRAVNGISDVPITVEMQQSCMAYVVKDDGTTQPVKTDITVRKLSTDARSGGNRYAVTAVARTSETTSSGTQEPQDSVIQVTATGTLYWVDGFGTGQNEITGATGSWNANKPSKSANRSVQLKAIKSKRWNGVGTDFDVSCSLMGDNVEMRTWADVYGPNGEKEHMCLFIKGSVFD